MAVAEKARTETRFYKKGELGVIKPGPTELLVPSDFCQHGAMYDGCFVAKRDLAVMGPYEGDVLCRIDRAWPVMQEKELPGYTDITVCDLALTDALAQNNAVGHIKLQLNQRLKVSDGEIIIRNMISMWKAEYFVTTEETLRAIFLEIHPGKKEQLAKMLAAQRGVTGAKQAQKRCVIA